MTGPYRTAPGVAFSGGVCPWCSAEVRFDAAVTSAICARCGARYAPALVRPRQPSAIDVPPGRGERVALWMLRAGLRGGAAIAIVFGSAFAVIGAFTVLVGTRGRILLPFIDRGLRIATQLEDQQRPLASAHRYSNASGDASPSRGRSSVVAGWASSPAWSRPRQSCAGTASGYTPVVDAEQYLFPA